MREAYLKNDFTNFFNILQADGTGNGRPNGLGEIHSASARDHRPEHAAFDLPTDAQFGISRAEGQVFGNATAQDFAPIFTVDEIASLIAPDAEPVAKKPGGEDKGKGNGKGKPDDDADPEPNADPVLSATYFSGDSTVADSAEYNVMIEFYGAWDNTLMNAFGAAADFVTSVVSSDLTDVTLAFRTFENSDGSDGYFDVDDILIEAYLPEIDGTGGILGQAGPYSVRSLSDATTVVGSMEFDAADAQSLEDDGNWDAVVLHEMMHVLGLGTLWSFWSAAEFDDNGTRRTKDDFETYVGVEGLAEFQEENGAGSKLLIEGDGDSGTAGSHWDEDTYGNELMTGFLDGAPYLADWSLASMNDIGYTTVDFSAGVGDNSLSDGIDLDNAALENAIVIVDDTLIA